MFFANNSILVNCVLSFLFSLVITIIGLKYLISYLKNHKAFQPIRIDGPLSHLMIKQKTPTMGGAISCLAIIFSSLLFGDLANKYTLIILCTSMSFGLIGFTDDFMKVFYRNDFGFRGSIKLVLQLLISTLT